MNIQTKYKEVINKENVYILVRKNHKNYKVLRQGKVIESDGIKLAIIGDSKTIYNLTHVETGMNIAYFDKLKDCYNSLPDIFEKLKNMADEYFKQGKKMFQKAELLENASEEV